MDISADLTILNPDTLPEESFDMQNEMQQNMQSTQQPNLSMDVLANASQCPLIDDYNAAQPMADMNLVMDMFGNPQFANPRDLDIMSGLPNNSFQQIPQPTFVGEPTESYDQWRLDQAKEIEAMRDTAVQHYNDAKTRGDIEEMLKWETEANKQQGRLYDHWETPTYGLPPKAPGIS